MTIRHHLSDPLLMAYAAGTIPEAFGLVIATHVSMCDDCRARLAAFEAVGGAVLETSQVEMSAGSLDACFDRISTMTPPAPPPARKAGVLPAPLQDYVGGDLERVRWRPLGFGAKQAILPCTDSAASVRLLAIPGGVAMPDHTHRGLELTLVLQGAFTDDDDRFERGDVEIADAEVDHTPVAAPGVTCICLAATQGRLKFSSLIPRLAQPFLRI